MKVPDATVQVAQRIGFEECALDRAASERDEEFAGLVNRQSRFAYRIAYALLRNSADSEDAVQEVFLKLYRSASWLQAEDEKAFLARATWRVAITRLRTQSKQRQVPEMIQNAEPGPEQGAIANGSMAAVHRMIDSLPEDLRQPLALSALEEMNSREIAVVMGIAEGTVRTRLMRARQLLKQKIEALHGGKHAK